MTRKECEAIENAKSVEQKLEELRAALRDINKDSETAKRIDSILASMKKD